MSSSSKVIGIIPARYESSRFPGKPLFLIAGKSLLQRTYENAEKSGAFDSLLIATDDPRIEEQARAFGADVVMTSKECPNGTQRLVEALEQRPSHDDDIILNVQGDIPTFEKEVIDAVVANLRDHPLEVMSTAATAITSEEEANSPSVVKCVLSKSGHALYFSRARIPYVQQTECPLYHHLGIYGFRKHFLLHYARLASTPLQQAEDLEQLKVLEQGYSIRVAVVESQSFGIDTPDDAKKLEEALQ